MVTIGGVVGRVRAPKGCTSLQKPKGATLLLIPLLLVALLKQLVWVAAIPPWQNPDEAAHYAYVDFLAVARKLPDASQHTTLPPEESQSLIWSDQQQVSFHSNVQIDTTKRHALAYRKQLQHPISFRFHGSTSATGYPPLYYVLNLPAYWLGGSNILLQLFFMRLTSAIFFLALVLLAYLIGSAADSRSLGLALAGLTAFQPEVSMVFASVNNDVLVDVFGAGLFLLALRAPSLIPARTRAATIGALLGLSLLSKAQAWPLVLIVLSLFAWHWRRHAQELAILALSTVIVYLPWAIFALIHYGNPIGIMAGQLHGDFPSSLSAFLTAQLRRTPTYLGPQIWADFGWLDTVFPSVVYRILQALEPTFTTPTASDGDYRLVAATGII